MATDPVCGMTVDPAKAGATAAHGGKTYYFCCKHCAAKFQAEPQKYLQPATDPVCGMKVEPANAADIRPGRLSRGASLSPRPRPPRPWAGPPRPARIAVSGL